MDTTTPSLQEIPKAYEPKDVEAKWIQRWEDLKVFHADPASDKKPFAMACPPPNVTGSLHLGHAVNGTIQDALARFKRMQGYEVLWQPGTDHAGIATQYVVEKKLLKEEKKSRHDLGREEFLKRVWDWKEEYGNTIHGQFKRLGASMDYDRWRFTMDEGYSKAVRKAFVELYKKGYIYRGNRMINWCTKCLTSLSDLEVDQTEKKDKLYYVRYPVEGGGEITVATVRPETMLGDVAVAVNPNDDRYKAFVGKQVTLPLANRPIPVIADEHVEVDFGTGALKITPAHDMNDYEIGQRHSLPLINTIDPKGALNTEAGAYAGLDRMKARTKVVEDLQAEGFLVKEEDYVHNVGHCSRCATVLEPYLSDQWFVRMDELAKPAIKVVEDGQITFHPDRWSGVYLDWMRNIRDWNISRQLWWGHQIPVWYCPDGHISVAEEDVTACQTCGSHELKRDSDVLDTWFSSALWPFATLGWPDTNTAEFKKFYPTQVLSTARDIIYLWVARMIFSSLEFLDEIPYSQVIIHATILDPEGRRMSKSKGTGVDPLVVMDKYGTDACRYWMAGAGTSSQDVRFREEKIEAYRNFANKLWNATRFVLTKAAESGETPQRPAKLDSAIDRWILSRLNAVTAQVSADLEAFEFAGATQALYEFTWNEFCDWYIELAKPRLDEGDPAVRYVLQTVLSTLVKLLHPLMPFITEEIHELLAARGWADHADTLQRTPWPTADESLNDPDAEREAGLLIDAVRTVRNMRAELKIDPAKKAEQLIVVAPAKDRPVLEAVAPLIARLSRSERVEVFGEGQAPSIAKAATGLSGENTLILPLEQFGDVIEKEITRLNKEVVALEAEQTRINGQLGNEGFVAKAPAAVVDKLRARQDEIVGQLTTAKQQLAKWQ